MNQDVRVAHRPHFREVALAGALAGVTSDTACHAIDTVKVRMQSPSATYRNTVDAFSTILKSEGIGGFYGGLSATVASASLCSVLYFWSYEKSKYLLGEHTNLPGGVTYLLGGCTGELATSMIFVPLEVLKTRMQVQAMCSSRRHEPYVSLAHAVQNVLKNEGWKGFYRGYSATMFREIPYAAVFFLVYEEVKRHVFSRGYSPDTHQHQTSQDTYEDTQSCENITSTAPPKDCVGRYPIEKSDGSNMGTFPAVVRNLEEGTEWVGTGIGGEAVIHNGTDIQDNDTGYKNSLWNSYKQTADKIIINANKFSDSEGDQYSDVDANNNAYLRPDEAIVTGAVAGAVACTVTIPFDVVKTRSQLTLGAHVGLMRTGVQLVAKEGWLVLFSGLPARILYQSPQAAMMILMYEWASSISSQIFDGS